MHLHFAIHRLALVLALGTLATGVYTSLVWWLCHPFVRHVNRVGRAIRRTWR